jgi:2',3'-cyclic-nucleotide 2'-phosphodiesterase (5'-nucleotidase family)
MLALAVLTGCRDRSPVRSVPIDPAPSRQLTVVGTNDLHGRLEQLPILASYLRVLRQRGPTIAIDAGDMIQGTMASNLNEGQAVIAAYSAMGYAAAAIGNHDFDFGPVGADREADAGADIHGALKARAEQADFPLLTANVVRASDGAPLQWRNVAPSAVVEVAGIAVGVVGVITETLPWVVRPSHLQGLRVTDAAQAVRREAAALRDRGVKVVIVAAHMGGRCLRLAVPDDLSSCEQDGEVLRLARALPPGLVDVIVAGHEHSTIAHRVNGVAVIESYSRGRAFGRVDLTLSAAGRVDDARIFPPQPIEVGSYHGQPVAADPKIARLIAADLAAAHALADESLGVTIARPVPHSQTSESPLGNLLVDLLHQARPDADLAIRNGGALRTGLPAGPLTYGRLFEALPFDNQVAELHVPAGLLRRDLAHALASSRDVISVSGARLVATCRGTTLELALERPDGRPIADQDVLHIVTSDYLAIGGDGLLQVDTLQKHPARFDDKHLVRDLIAEQLRGRGGTLSGRDRSIYDPKQPRLRLPGPPPVECGRATPVTGSATPPRAQ